MSEQDWKTERFNEPLTVYVPEDHAELSAGGTLYRDREYMQRIADCFNGCIGVSSPMTAIPQAREALAIARDHFVERGCDAIAKQFADALAALTPNPQDQ